MGCLLSTPINPDIPYLPKNILQLNYKSDPILLKNVQDTMTHSFAGTTTTSPEGVLAWVFDPRGYINNDFSDDELLNGNISIEIEKIKYPAEIIFEPLKQTNFKNS